MLKKESLSIILIYLKIKEAECFNIQPLDTLNEINYPISFSFFLLILKILDFFAP